MNRVLHAIVLVGMIAGAFSVGSWYTQRATASSPAAGARKILYYVDPMHPAYRADKPGIAPDCGMELAPVYEDGSMGGRAGGASSEMRGTVRISSETKQLIGVRIAPAEKASGSHAVRLLGRVAADETRTYRLNAGIDGFIRDVSAVTTGDRVQKEQVLATFSAPNSTTVVQSYILASGALDRARQSAAERSVEAQAAPLANANIRQRAEQLQNMGMSALQMEEIKETRQVPESIKILAPGDGIVLARNVSVDQKFDRGTELYRIADLRQVWIVADVFESEAQYLQPGKTVKVSLPQQRQTFHARVSTVRPQFDPATRTLKVRLEADNPGDILRPDMFVDIELPVTFSPTVIVPADAVVDSGLKQIVYVATGEGAFEPRRVESGWRHGDQVEIVKGLMAGERIVVSGTFLIDSESRMKAAGTTGHMHEGHAHAQEATPTRSPDRGALALALLTDPVCDMEVDRSKARAAGWTTEYAGHTYYFCSDDCKEKFAKEPSRYSRKSDKGPATPAGKRLEQAQWAGGNLKEKESAHAGHMHPPAPAPGPPGHQHP